MSLALNDVMLCLEMPIFAIAHQYAFCRLDDYGQCFPCSSLLPSLSLLFELNSWS
jgi:hypothetical protein